MANKLAKVVITLDGSRVEVGLDKIRQKVQQLTGEMNKLAMEGKQNTKEFKEKQKAVDKLHKAEEDVVNVTKRISQYMKNLGGVATTDLRRAYKEGLQLREGFKGTDKELKILNADLAAMKAQIDKNTDATNKHNSAWGSLGTTLKNLVAYAGVFAMFNKLKSLFGDFVSLNRELSDQLANIRKVSGLAMQDINKLEANLAKIDTRSTIQELNELAYTGAKLGFGSMGSEALEGFVKSALKVQNALKEDMGEDSMTALSKLVEVMGLIPKMGVERAMDAAGSAIFKLASTSTATGTNIIEFTKRLMGLANVSHVTTSELLALGSASDSMGLMAEVSSTAFTKMFTSIQSNYSGIEKAVGLAQGTLKSLLDQGRTMDALVEVFDKMHGMSMEEMKARGIFKELGSEGSRMNNVMTTMANKIDMLREHLLTSNEAFEDANAVAKEYEIQMDTAQAYAERAANIFQKAFVNPEGVDVVRDFSKAWYEVAKSLTSNEKFMFSMQISLKGILLLLKGIMTILPELIGMALSGAAWAWITKLKEGEGLLTSLTAWFGKLTAAQKAFFKAAGWVGLALFVYEAGKAFYDMANNVKKASEYMKGFKANLSEVNKEQYTAERQLKSYVKAINEAAEGTNQRKAAINNFNKVYKPYLSQMLTEKSTALDVAKAYQEVVKQMKAKIALQAKEKDIEKFINPRMRWEADRLEAFDESVAGTGNQQYNGAWLKGFVDDARAAGKSIEEIAEQLNEQIFHLDKEAFSNVYKQRGEENVTRREGATIMNASAGAYAVDNIVTLGSQTAEAQLQKAIQYAMQSYSTSNAMKRIDKKYKPWQDEMDKLVATEEVIEPYTPPGGPEDKNGTDKEKAKELKEKYDAAKEQATGVIAKIDELYNLQEAAVKDAQALGELTSKEADDLVKTMEIARNEALMRARKAVGSGEQDAINDWESWAKNEMPKLIADSSKWSTELYGDIINVHIKDLYDFLKSFDGNNIAKIDSRAFLDSILKKGAENKKKSAVIAAQFKDRTDKFLQQYEVIELAQKKMRDDMQAIGIMTETAEEMAKRIAEGREKQPKRLKNGNTITDEEAYTQMGAKFIGQGAIPYRINIENADEALQWIQQFATNAKGELEDWAQAFPNIEVWVTLLQRKNELMTEGKELTEAETEELAKIPEKLAEAIPAIKAMFYQLETSANQVAATIEKQVNAMIGRKPIGLAEMSQQHEARLSLTSQLYDNKINNARGSGNEDAAIELEKQKQQALIELEYQYQQELYEIREKMGATIFDQYENEVAMYKNMADKKLITEKEFQQKKGQLQMKLGLNVAQQYNGMMSDMINALQEAEIASVEAKYDAEINAAKANGQDTTALEEQKEAEIMEIRKKYAGMQFAVKISEIIANTAVAIMQAYAQLGPIAGSVAAAMLTATGAAQLALAKAEYNKVMGMQVAGNKSSSSSSNTKTKIVSGMLTYDEGNVKRFIGQDGKVYTATEEPQPKDGLVTHPIATTVQGRPALVAENGPEIVIGRETTKAIMMNEPGLIRYLAEYQKHGGSGYRQYDNGNLGSDELRVRSEEFAAAADNGQSPMANGQLLEVMQSMLYYLQHPVRPKINMFPGDGEDGLYQDMQNAKTFMSRYGG